MQTNSSRERNIYSRCEEEKESERERKRRKGERDRVTEKDARARTHTHTHKLKKKGREARTSALTSVFTSTVLLPAGQQEQQWVSKK